MAICNLCCSLCCTVVSAWGVVQLLVMGILFWVQSPSLIADIHGMWDVQKFKSFEEFSEVADEGFRQTAINCWIAVAIYFVSFLLSGHQFYLNTLKHKFERDSHTVLFKSTMAWCNLCCSLCCTIVSCWGVIQLVVMGFLYWFQSVALIEDIPYLGEHYTSYDKFVKDANDGYREGAVGCWIAAGLYLVTFLMSGHQFYLNTREK